MNLETFLKLFAWACRAVRWITLRRPNSGAFLIVEDNDNDAENLARKLAKRGRSSEIATSGEAAAGLVKHTHYPVCFIDMRLPSMSGPALLRVLSRDAPNSEVVIVCGEPSDLNEVPAGQLILFIKKPVTLEAIEDILKKLRL